MPFFSAGIDCLSPGKTDAAYARMRHHTETDANCTIVKVTGFGKAVNIDFEEVLVSADVMYHATESAYMHISVVEGIYASKATYNKPIRHWCFQSLG